MHYTATADTDVGIVKDTNQDSLLIKHASYDGGEVLMAIVCDGMGGFAKGELASATVIRAFSAWFDKELPYELEHLDMQVLGGKWSMLLKVLNERLLSYGKSIDNNLGTTFSGILLAQGQYLIAHVGDSRIYHIGFGLTQMTTDQSFVAKEVRRGNMTPEQARTDKRRNLLLQCVGASRTVEAEISFGRIARGVYMLCSDGFWHEITDSEMYESLNLAKLADKNAMHSSARYLINQAKARKELDNISVVLIKAE